MRLLHCVPTLGGGGAERQLAYLACHLAANGWEVHIALLRGGHNLGRVESGGVIVHTLSGLGHHDPRLLWRLRKIVRRTRPQVIHTWITQMDVLAGSVALAAGVPWVIAEQNSAPHYPPTWKNRLRLALGRRASAVISNSGHSDQYWAAVNGRARRYVVPNGLPLAEIEAAPGFDDAQLGLAPTDRVVLLAGRFSPEKNVAGLVRALPAVALRPDVRVVLCGEGPERALVEGLVQELGLAGRVILAGYRADIWALMKRAEVFVSLSWREGQPNAVQEAMASGCPLVVSDIPGHREILDETSALLVPPDSPEAIAQALEATLDDPVSARERAVRARAQVAVLSIPALAARYEAVYRDVTR
jgi:glycosyltransferase involved in cell wall biosynthesis